MKSNLPKVLHPLNDRPMVLHVLDIARSLRPRRLILIVGFQKEQVMEAVKANDIVFVHQDDPQGTGHAILQTETALEGFAGDVLILSGDVPLLPKPVLEDFVRFHRQKNAWMTLMTADLEDPTGYGRIVRNEQGFVSAIVEEKDADDWIRRIKEFNSGIYLIRSDNLFDRLKQISNDNAKSEYYLTDIVGIAVRQGLPVAANKIEDANLVLGINTIEELAAAEGILTQRIASEQ